MSDYEEIIYTYKNNVYLNITNKCPCACTFCIRSKTDAIGEASNLWLNHNPDFDEVKKASVIKTIVNGKIVYEN